MAGPAPSTRRSRRTLAPGDTATSTFTSTITAADVTNNNVNNTASVTANALQVAVTDTATAECPFNPVEGVEITKSCPVIPAGARVGDSIAYSVTIANTGDVPLTNVVVTDSRDGTFNSPFPATLAPGAAVTRTFTSTITFDDAAFGDVDNFVEVSASAAGVAVGDEAFADCPFDPVGSVDITKSCPVIPAGARVGDPISYKVTIANTGDVNLVNIVVTETRTGTLNAAVPDGTGAGRLGDAHLHQHDHVGGRRDRQRQQHGLGHGRSGRSDAVGVPGGPGGRGGQ